MKLGIHEILRQAGDEKTVGKKVEILRKYDSVPLRTILRYAYDPEVEFLLPDSEPPYTPSESPEGHGMLYSEARRLRIFVKGGGYDNLDQFRREVLFVGILEAIHPNDAQVLIEMLVNRKFKGITVKTVDKAFPDLI